MSDFPERKRGHLQSFIDLPFSLDEAKSSAFDAKNPRNIAMLEDNFPGVVELMKREVQISVVSAHDFLAQLYRAIEAGDIEQWGTFFKESGVACQFGLDRSDRLKALSVDLGIPVALTQADENKLLQKPASEAGIGMSYKDLGKLIEAGQIRMEGVLPEGFSRALRAVIGFTDGVRDLNDFNKLCQSIAQKCEDYVMETLPMRIILVEGKGPAIQEYVAQMRKDFGVDSQRKGRE
jgi:hypothetical protein